MDWTPILLKVLYAGGILLVGTIIASWLTGLVGMAMARSRLDPIVQRLLTSMVRPVVLALAIFAALGVLGIPITTFAAITGAITLAVGMSMQGSLSNVASGAMLLSLRPFGVDDTISAGGHTGKVVSLELFSTVLATPDGNTVTLPNDVVWKGAITTYTRTPTARIDLSFTLDQDTDLAKVEKAMLALMASEERALEEPAPSVLYGETSDLGPVLTARAWAANADKAALTTDLRRAILAKLRSSKVRLATRAG